MLLWRVRDDVATLASKLSQFQGLYQEVNMKKACIILFVLTLFMGMLETAYADCIKDGKTYPTDTVIGPFICTADGTWKKV